VVPQSILRQTILLRHNVKHARKSPLHDNQKKTEPTVRAVDERCLEKVSLVRKFTVDLTPPTKITAKITQHGSLSPGLQYQVQNMPKRSQECKAPATRRPYRASGGVGTLVL